MKYILLTLILAQNLWTKDTINVVTSIPSIKSIVEEIGGNYVKVNSIGKAKQNPHYVSVKPSFVKLVKRADLVVVSGLDLEVAWMPLLIKKSNNRRVFKGTSGYLDLSIGIEPLQVIGGVITRKMGDVHGSGNPHYFVSPFQVLGLIPLVTKSLIAIKPNLKKELLINSKQFQEKLGHKIFGRELATKYNVDKLLKLHKIKKLDKFLSQSNQKGLLGGWVKLLKPFQNLNFWEDHSSYSYFMEDFSLNRVGALEPKPGIMPSFRSLSKLILKMKKTKSLAVLSSSFFPKKFLDFVKSNSSLKVIQLSHQLGSRSASGSYISWIDYNVNQMVNTLGSKSAK
ncbi:MAG: zinc ABC transporter substrate-binding protein [Candidatus Cloacimonetes bacterium]|nr:zinc ABC transporter substrate-binding protein [Candidatus Cloacimonadota bacterium]